MWGGGRQEAEQHSDDEDRDERNWKHARRARLSDATSEGTALGDVRRANEAAPAETSGPAPIPTFQSREGYGGGRGGGGAGGGGGYGRGGASRGPFEGGGGGDGGYREREYQRPYDGGGDAYRGRGGPRGGGGGGGYQQHGRPPQGPGPIPVFGSNGGGPMPYHDGYGVHSACPRARNAHAVHTNGPELVCLCVHMYVCVSMCRCVYVTRRWDGGQQQQQPQQPPLLGMPMGYPTQQQQQQQQQQQLGYPAGLFDPMVGPPRPAAHRRWTQVLIGRSGMFFLLFSFCR